METTKQTNSILKRYYSPLSKITFIFLGILSTIWFLVRVIPKPSRAFYPCMRTAAPIASSFVIYLIALAGSVLLYKKTITNLGSRKFVLTALIFVGFILFQSISFTQKKANSQTNKNNLLNNLELPTEPIGIANGFLKGQVSWVRDVNASNEDVSNKAGDYWYMDKNSNQVVISNMLNSGINSIGGGSTISESWNNLFTHFNEKQGNGNTGYIKGEHIAIKINLTNSCCGMDGTEKVSDKDRMDATPQLALALLESLIEDAGIAESDIYLGDPFRIFRDEYWDKCHTAYPNVHYMDGHGLNGREQTQGSKEALLFTSDGNTSAHIPQHFVDAKYIINMPCLKTHNATGITIAAKNHQGSVLKSDQTPDGQYAEFMHYSMPFQSSGYKQYRNLVDYMGHKDLGKKTMLVIVDAIWGGDDWEGNIFKWQMTPFNDNYPNSIFLSQDPVAIEAVCYDFLRHEFSLHNSGNNFPAIDGGNDYLFQAASTDYWPDGLIYDPEEDGIAIESLGVFETWDNAVDKQYSGNLGNKEGITLVYTELNTVNIQKQKQGFINSINVYPNPTNFENTNIEIQLTISRKNIDLKITSITGKYIANEKIVSLQAGKNMINLSDYSNLPSGNYIISISDNNNLYLTKRITKI